MTYANIEPLDANKPPVGRNDPVLRELWQIKAVMNAEAGYSVAVLAERVRKLNVAELTRRVNAGAAQKWPSRSCLSCRKAPGSTKVWSPWPQSHLASLMAINTTVKKWRGERLHRQEQKQQPIAVSGLHCTVSPPDGTFRCHTLADSAVLYVSDDHEVTKKNQFDAI